MTATTTPAVDVNVWGHTAALREAEAAVDAATASGDVEQIATARRRSTNLPPRGRRARSCGSFARTG